MQVGGYLFLQKVMLRVPALKRPLVLEEGLCCHIRQGVQTACSQKIYKIKVQFLHTKKCFSYCAFHKTYCKSANLVPFSHTGTVPTYLLCGSGSSDVLDMRIRIKCGSGSRPQLRSNFFRGHPTNLYVRRLLISKLNFFHLKIKG